MITRNDLIVGGWMLATMLTFYHNFLFVHSVTLSYGYTFGSYGVGLVYARHNATIRRLLVIGTIGGFVELLGDYFLVHIAGTLVYPSGHTYLVSSPGYMPFAWALLITFMGYLAIRLNEQFGKPAAYLGPAAIALISESGFESLAREGGGWIYTSAPLGWIGHAPLFIVTAEAFMFMTVFYWIRRTAIIGGLGIGLTINASYIGVYYLFDLLGSI